MNETWIKYLVAGILMISLSNMIFGGLAFIIMEQTLYWASELFLGVGAFSSLVTGVLMVYDSLRMRIKKDMIKESGLKQIDKNKVKNHIKLLHEEAEKVKPENMG